MKSKSLIVLMCVLFHTLHICSMEQTLGADAVHVSGDEQATTDVSSSVVPVKDKSPQEEHWYDLTVGKWNVPGGKIAAGALGAGVIGILGGNIARRLWKSGEPEWAKRFHTLLKDVDMNNQGFKKQWIDYERYDGQNQGDEEREMPNPYDLLKKDEFMGTLNDEGKKEFLTILKQLDKGLWDSYLREIISRKDQKEFLKELLELEKREDVFKDPYVQHFEDWEQRSLMQLHVELNNRQILRDNVEWSL